ncbi:vancomycin resistance histidine kinase VanS [Virgibacillus pantothenticus]|uniref:histidine kinase n=1 Tax=Virgibacillus pantothenticus TaxID=1473 RepID=A0A0L0QK37_VIRPA|nr:MULTISPECIES: HAMP domain-containing sensor histidine kinase [Virgibacillus]API92816.1 vancomycin resistance histidine kinase VanS [Virgibacillus sp. 6R]KNE18947.1 histidine kinase [Virgibacillus pantothenticus]MBS7428324.1 HAMP domain-containing histidine kinase [Virgibacillus sp. 19R1-5]MED3737544.1 HAMP domain-containing sensor histidine kinase [Virgibacillus pantothenticus]QTY15374.1 HAMP domain-containing histidine kinase [Virgibacillus pantothenticus]
MGNRIKNFRTKMVMLFGLSMLFAGVVTFSIFLGLRFYYHNYVQVGEPLANIRSMIATVGDFNFFILLFIPLSIMFFYLLTKRYSLYFKEISQGIHQLANGNFTHHVQIDTKDEFHDIAEDINAAADKLQQAIERGEFAESSKDQLIVNLAHDLRTPLTSVLGYLDVVLKDEHLTDEQKRHYLSISYKKSQRLEALINELFDITKMNYGMLQLDKTEINLGELLQQLNEEFYPMLEKNHIRTRLDIQSSLMITADGEKLARVFENLLTNAIRYGADGKFIDIKAFQDTNDIVVQVINYGDSIPDDVLPNIFEMFFKQDQSRTYKAGSTGLGLFIAKNIVEQHGGSIEADSTVIRTIFEVRLPK